MKTVLLTNKNTIPIKGPRWSASERDYMGTPCPQCSEYHTFGMWELEGDGIVKCEHCGKKFKIEKESPLTIVAKRFK
jgi:Zn ribbon nucleic-acid-binding protein